FGQLLIIHGDTLLLWRDKAYHFSAVGFFYTSIRVSQLLSEFWPMVKTNIGGASPLGYRRKPNAKV
ncbi:hypothetical protein, partial [Shewanella sp.]|uniref:hypothetical protein n=1 Tax=Shewanella sp. TaxID=50422 RepID=UPI001B5EE2CD